LTETLTETPIPSASHALSKSEFQIIGEKYGVPPNLLRALSAVGSQNGRVPGDYEVRKVVDDEQLKFLGKIAEDTGRPISDFKGSSAGAMGYIQFMPTTFYYYAQDGNGDGIKDPLNSYDSVATAAYFLAQKIAKENSIEAALKSYSNNPTFYEKILKLYWKLESEEKS
jgi:membrane-bound lytic murein transglycosylase B